MQNQHVFKVFVVCIENDNFEWFSEKKTAFIDKTRPDYFDAFLMVKVISMPTSTNSISQSASNYLDCGSIYHIHMP